MRLLRVDRKGRFSLVNYTGRDVPAYAILSHTWGPTEEEVSFKNLSERSGKKKGGYQKLVFCATQALKDGLEFFWVDTCCIDKSSSAELSEAINSMFLWYRDAKVCYVYLSDVSRVDVHSLDWQQEFRKSKWFTRGWTLQELLAPRDVVFYDKQWRWLGTKTQYVRLISETTAIDKDALASREHGNVQKRLDRFSVAKRMSWASRRKTTRTEDLAYCLLGIFNVNMPLLYGERERAFIRLQEEIMKNNCDDSILAWDIETTCRTSLPEFHLSYFHSPILASSPWDFRNCGNLICAMEPDTSFNMTNLGLEIQLPMVQIGSKPSKNPYDASATTFWLGLLNCTPDTTDGFVGILLCTFAALDASKKLHVERNEFIHVQLQHPTMVVGPRVAVRSVLQTVIILQRGENSRRPLVGGRKVIINQSPKFLSTGYGIGDATGLHTDARGISRYRSSWDRGMQVLTMEHEYILNDIHVFQFGFTAKSNSKSRETDRFEPGSESRKAWSAQSFTLFFRTDCKRIMVQRGTSFSKQNLRSIYNSVHEHETSPHNLTEVMSTNSGHVWTIGLDETILRDSEGKLFQVKVQITETVVYAWLMFEVTIDAQPVTRVPRRGGRLTRIFQNYSTMNSVTLSCPCLKTLTSLEGPVTAQHLHLKSIPAACDARGGRRKQRKVL